jgi:hypothetical protein
MIKHRLHPTLLAALCGFLALSGLARAEDYATTTFAGTALVAGSADGTPGTFNNPYGIAIDAAKNLYVSDTTNQTIRKISPSRVVTTLAGSAGVFGTTDGPGTSARFNFPIGLAVDASGNVYVADSKNSVIRKITPAGVVSTYAGTALQYGSADGPAASARFFIPCGVAVDSAGVVYVADTGNHVIRKITTDGVVSTLAGSAQQSGTTNGTGAGARFNLPWGIALDRSGGLFVSDSGSNTIRRVSSAGVVTTFAGVAGSSGAQDGAGVTARFNLPRGISVDAAGNLFVADTGNNTLRLVSAAGIVSTPAGNPGVSGAVDSVGVTALFYDPMDVVTDGTAVYVVDSSNNLIRRGVPASSAPLPVINIQPVEQEISVGQSLTFRVSATGSALTYQWLRNGQAIAGATNSTYVISSARSEDSASYRVRIAGAGGSVDSQPGNLTVTPLSSGPIIITARPIGLHVITGQSAAFSVTATGPNLRYQWLKNGVAINGATTSTFQIAAAQPADAGDYAVRLTSDATTETAFAKLVVTSGGTSGLAISAQPLSQTVKLGDRVTLSVTATANSSVTYQWFKNDTAIPGATASTYVIPSVQESDLGAYVVRVGAGGDTATSAAGIISSEVVIPPPPPPPPPGPTSRLVNLSILTSLSGAGDSFTMGYVVGGSGTSGSKPILIRAAGPTLGAAPFNIGGALADPKLELFAGTTKTSENDNWGGSAALSSAFASVGAFAYVSPTSLDAAAVANIAPGDNSVRVTAANNGSGLVIAELYDSTPFDSLTASSPRLVNVSVLKQLGTGLTAGFVIDGTSTKKVLIRAVGPTIGAAPFNVPGAVADPQLTLFSGQTSIGSNDNWGGTAELTAAFAQVGAFALPAGSRDAAVLATLSPGSYTVQVSGVGGTTGTAIVEVYEVP